MPRARHRDRRRVLRPRSRRRARALRRRGVRARRPDRGRELPQHRGDPRRDPQESGADGVHPGYGFFSENADFARARHRRGRHVDRPAARSDRSDGRQDLVAARGRSAPRSRACPARPTPITDASEIVAFGERVRLPDRDQGRVRRRRARHEGRRRAPTTRRRRSTPRQREAQAYFGRAECYMERYLTRPRHVELQIFCDTHGNGVYLSDRDCSAQRRHQKLIEEAPAPAIPDDDAPRDGRSRGEGRARLRLRQRGHRRDAVPGRRVLLPRDEHAPAGRALRHRRDHRPRPRRRADPRRGGRAALVHAGLDRAARPLDRVPHQRRRPVEELPAVAGHDHAAARAVGSGRALGRRLRRGRHDLAVLRQPRRQADRVGARPRPRDRAHAPRARRVRDRGRPHDDPRAPRAARTPTTSAPSRHSTKWVEDEVDADQFAARARRRRGRDDRRRPTPTKRSSSGPCRSRSTAAASP